MRRRNANSSLGRLARLAARVAVGGPEVVVVVVSVLESLDSAIVVDPPLYVPPDIFEDEVGSSAHCGPCAVAALLGRTLAEVKASGTPLHQSMNLTQARAALAAFDRSATKTEEPRVAGLAHVMWDGPWNAAGPRVQYRYSHWIAYRRVAGILAVYDVNAGEAGRWLTLWEWDREVVPLLLPEKGTGFHVNAWLEVSLSDPAPGDALSPGADNRNFSEEER